ncbi:dTDP-4-keto-L-rhamnose reductase [Thalassolituus oleivorans R6-15]|nr:dTDP-4-keto-L-rhamnose reductase [Thalassolituus oleivorans R6-15]PCI49785.1 MAG: hypothetical protein COB43_03575 [Oceanospirillales bacterium]
MAASGNLRFFQFTGFTGILTLAISSFHTHIIGANRPVGKCLTRLLAEQNFMYKGVSLESRERQGLQSSGRPVYVLTPSVYNPEDFQHLEFWIDQARSEDAAIVLLSSMAVIEATNGTLVDETWHVFSDTQVAQHLLAIEELVRQNPQHLILRAGQVFSLMNDDFATRLLTAIRHEQILTVDMKRHIAPTPADDVAEVMLAMFKQASCADHLWGTYHFSGVEPVSSYAFAEALLSEARQYENLGAAELHSQEGGQVPYVWTPLSDNTLLFHSFGIKPKAWRKGLSRLIRQYYRVDMADSSVSV